MRRVAVLGAALARGASVAGVDEVVVLDPSPSALLGLMREVREPAWTFQLGELPVLPLPDGYVDEVVGGDGGDEVRRVTR
jgi:hypothetical protein